MSEGSGRVGVAHGEAYGVDDSDTHESSGHKRLFFSGVGNSGHAQTKQNTL